MSSSKRPLVLSIAGGLLLVGVASVLGQGIYTPDAPLMQPVLREPVDGKGGSDISGPYESVIGWPKPIHADWRTGAGISVYAESPDRVYVAFRGEIPAKKESRVWGYPIFNDLRYASRDQPQSRWEHIVCVFDRAGNLLESWEQRNSMLKGPNRLLTSRYDPERHIWIVDQTLNKVFEFTHDGRSVVLTVEDESVKGSEPEPFRPQDMAWLPNGDFYVTGRSRVIRFSKDGKYISGFGKPGRAPGEFDGTHGIIADPDANRIYIADRGNSRIQVFDLNGKFLDQWPNILAIYSMRMTKDRRHIWVGDGAVHKFLKYDALTGKLDTTATWGTFGIGPGAIWSPHYFDTDSEGNLYVTEDYGARVQKFRPKKDGNPAQLIGELLR